MAESAAAPRMRTGTDRSISTHRTRDDLFLPDWACVRDNFRGKAVHERDGILAGADEVSL